MIEGFVANFTRTQLSARKAAAPIVDRMGARTDVGADADPSVLIAVGAELVDGRARRPARRRAGGAPRWSAWTGSRRWPAPSPG